MKTIVYQITNVCNGKRYVGVHTTEIIEDGYLGSGVLISRAVKKYGRENFKREILFECDDRDEALEIEAKIVNDAFLKDPDTYNLALGGGCGWYYVNEVLKIKSFSGKTHTEESRLKMSESIRRTFSDPAVRKRMSDVQRIVQNDAGQRARNSRNQKIAQNRADVAEKKRIAGLKRFETEESRKAHSEACRTERSRRLRRESKIGKIWIWHPGLSVSRQIDHDELSSFLDSGWIRGMLPRRVTNGKTVAD